MPILSAQLENSLEFRNSSLSIFTALNEFKPVLRSFKAQQTTLQFLARLALKIQSLLSID